MPNAPINIKRYLYPQIEPYAAEHIDVGDGHSIYVEQSGNQHGIPVLFIHGGPGGGCNPLQRRFFDPELYRIILFDQRGCGHSRPHASIDHNTTWHLISDMETIRKKFKIDQWILFGGSWGSTLALLYAQKHTAHVHSIILRGIFLMMERELRWFYQEGTSAIFPEAYENFIELLPEDQREDVITAYYKLLTGADTAKQLVAAKRWSIWEGSSVTLIPEDTQTQQLQSASFALAFARLEAHYFYNKGFLECDDQILKDCTLLQNIPMSIVQGRYDAICPPRSAWALKKQCPHADLNIIKVAGHSAFEPDIIHALVTATDKHAKLYNEG